MTTEIPADVIKLLSSTLIFCPSGDTTNCPTCHTNTRAILEALRADPELAAAALGLERGVDTRVATDRFEAVVKRDVLRYPWEATS